MTISPGVFYLFIFFFGLLGGDKRAKKMAQDDKKFHLLHFISQEPYIIWLSFMVHLCKIMISPGVFFFFFQNFDSLGCDWVWGKRAKNCPKWEKILPVALYIWGIIHHMIFIYGTSFMVLMCKMIISPEFFFILSRFWFSRLLEG